MDKKTLVTVLEGTEPMVRLLAYLDCVAAPHSVVCGGCAVEIPIRYDDGKLINYGGRRNRQTFPRCKCRDTPKEDRHRSLWFQYLAHWAVECAAKHELRAHPEGKKIIELREARKHEADAVSRRERLENELKNVPEWIQEDAK